MVKRSIGIGTSIIVIGLVIGLLFYGFKPYLEVNLNGTDKVIEVHTDYLDEGVSSCYGSKFKGCKKEANVETINNVNKDVLGVYDINYKVSYRKLEKVITRKVEVVDTTAPELTVEESEILACPNANSFNLNYQAIDNYDGDITTNVKKVVEDNNLKLTIVDSSNNETSKSLPITYQDKEKPKITLKGDKTIYLYIGSNYVEPGYTASDNCSGDLTKNVKVINNVDTSKAGTYYITYQVSDNYNNETTVQRTIKVRVNEPTVNKGNKIIYLTFDDGPSIYTNTLLDILKQYNVKATFFVTWQHPAYASSIKRAYQEGHSIGLHTYSHVYKNVYASMDAYFNDLEAISNEVKNLIGIESKLIRFPGGSSNTVSKNVPHLMTNLASEVETRGYRYFDWNVSSNDTQTNNSTTIANNVIKSLKNGTYIVLQHDIKKGSVNAVKTIIEYGLTHGYTFLPLDMTSPTTHHHINN